MQDVERVEQAVGDWRDVEQARRVGLSVLAPDRLYEERDDLKRTFARAALGGGDAFGGLTPEQIAAEVAEIERRVLARRMATLPS